MEKMTIDEFFKLEDEKLLAIHPGNKKNSLALRKAFDKKGYTWCTGEKYVGHSNYIRHKDETCYDNTGRYAPIDFYKRNDYTIFEFEDVDLR